MIFKPIHLMKKPIRSKKAQGMVEYTFIISLIALALVIALATLGSNLSDFFNMVAQQIQINIL